MSEYDAVETGVQESKQSPALAYVHAHLITMNLTLLKVQQTIFTSSTSCGHWHKTEPRQIFSK